MPASKRTKKYTQDMVTVGSAVVDSYAASPLFEMERDSKAPSGWNACVPLGAKIALTSIVTDAGGGATNTGVTFTRMGLKTAAVCRVGQDLFGDFLVANTKKHKIDTKYIQRDPENGTGQSIILVAGMGERTIMVHRAASEKLNGRQVPWTRLAPRWFYVTSLGGDLGLFEMILHRAEQIGAHVAWNPGRRELDKGLQRLTPFIKRVDIFNLNREEASCLTNKPMRHLNTLIQTLGGLPKIAFLLSDGSHGSYLTSRGCTWHAPSLPGKRVNTTGAGDALGSGFVAGFIRTCDLSIGLRMGMLNANSVIAHMGAKAGILKGWPTDKELARVKIKPVRL